MEEGTNAYFGSGAWSKNSDFPTGWMAYNPQTSYHGCPRAIAGSSLTHVVRPEEVNGLPMAMVAEPLSPLFSLDVINHPRTKVHVGRGTACVIIAVRGPAIGTEF